MLPYQQDQGSRRGDWQNSAQSWSGNQGQRALNQDALRGSSMAPSFVPTSLPPIRLGSGPAISFRSGTATPNYQPLPSTMKDTTQAERPRPPRGSIPVAHLLSSNPPSPTQASGNPFIGSESRIFLAEPRIGGQEAYWIPTTSTLNRWTTTADAPQCASFTSLPPSTAPIAPQVAPAAMSSPAQRPFDQLAHFIRHDPRSQLNRPDEPIPHQNTLSPLAPTRGTPLSRVYSPASSAYSSSRSQHDQLSPRSSSGHSHSAHPFPPITQVPPLNYELLIRQQPTAARACGHGERDRRVVDPPPILQLRITSKSTGAPESDSAHLALHSTLMSSGGATDETIIENDDSKLPSTRLLMGTLVATPYQAKDEHGKAGTFFVFSDLSCRSPGTYRLKFVLLRVDPMNMFEGAKHGSVATMFSDVFTVYTAKDFPGMRASSALLKALRKQGLNVGIKKGSEARKAKGRPLRASRSDSEEDGDSEVEDDKKNFRVDAARESLSPRSSKMLSQRIHGTPKRRRTNI